MNKDPREVESLYHNCKENSIGNETYLVYDIKEKKWTMTTVIWTGDELDFDPYVRNKVSVKCCPFCMKELNENDEVVLEHNKAIEEYEKHIRLKKLKRCIRKPIEVNDLIGVNMENVREEE